MYAQKLTKADLVRYGITNVTEDCRVFMGERELKLYKNSKTGYFFINTYALDENNNRIKMPRPDKCKYAYKTKSIGLHRLMWAWFHEEVPEYLVVDHINNKHDKLEDYRLENLQLLTSKANVNKEKTDWHTRELYCDLTKPRSILEDKLKFYEADYLRAKKDRDPKRTHLRRANISQIRANLRFYDSHIELFNTPEYRSEYTRLTSLRSDLNKQYKALKKAYGADDSYVMKVYYELQQVKGEIEHLINKCKIIQEDA